MQGNVITGAGYLFRGLAMLSQPGIRSFVILPLLANIGFFLFLGGAAYSYVTDLVATTEQALPDWLSFITWIIVFCFLSFCITFIMSNDFYPTSTGHLALVTAKLTIAITLIAFFVFISFIIITLVKVNLVKIGISRYQKEFMKNWIKD